MEIEFSKQAHNLQRISNPPPRNSRNNDFVSQIYVDALAQSPATRTRTKGTIVQKANTFRTLLL